MDKLILNIPKLRDAVAESNVTVASTKEVGKTISTANRRLTAPGTWQGDSANAYKGKAVQFDKNFKVQENMVAKMKDAMRVVLLQAEGLNRQALGFAGTVGGSSSSGSRDMLTYDPNAKAGAINACNRAISQIDSQLDQVRKAENSLSGLYAFLVLAELALYRRKLNDRKNKLNKLRQAIEKYASSAEALVTAAARAYGGIDISDGALATLRSWFITLVEIADMLKGLNLSCCAYGGDPVNLATGNFVFEKEYLRVGGLFPLSFKMFYNAQEKRTGALGHGWVHNFGVDLKESDAAVTLRMEDGREEIFYKNENGTYTQYFNKYDSLRKNSKGFIYRNSGQISYHFNDNGSVVKIEDQNSNNAALTYEQGRLVRVDNNTGGSLLYEYSPEGALTRVSDHTGRSVALSYEGGRMCTVINEEGHERQYRYDEKGRIGGIVNPLGVQTLTNEYDSENRISKQAFPDGGAIQYEYCDGEKELSVTEQNGNKVTYGHDDRMRTTAVTWADGEERYAYNEQNQRTWQIDKNGNETHYGYDDRGNVSQVTNALGETMATEYNELNKPLSVSLCGTGRMTGEYDSRGNLLTIRDALDRTRKVSYNEKGQPVSVTQPDGSRIEISHDERGNIVRVVDGASVTRYEYDEISRVVATTDPNGNRTSYGYNRRDELVKVTNAEGKERTYEYNRAGKLTKAKDFDGGESLYEYNVMNKPTRYVDPDGRETRLEYDLMWNVTRQTGANGAQTQYEYDKLQRPVKATNALGHSVKYEYDPNGNRTCITDPQGGQTRIAYDALDRLSEVTEADGAKTSVTYNEMGQVTSVTDAMGNTRVSTYDAAGQKIEETDAMGNKTTYTYTPLGQLETATDPAGRVTTFDYLPGGLLYCVRYADGRWTGYGYDAAKNIVEKQDQSGYTLDYTYDTLNRIVRISSNQGQEKHYTYDTAGHVTSMTDANGNTTRYVYSAAGKCIQITDALGAIIKYDYDTMGELVQIKEFAGGAGIAGVDGELSEAQSINKSNSKLRMTTYHRNPLGQIEYTEDALGQRESYTYDSIGRICGKTDKDSYITQYAYGKNGQLEHIQYADGKTVHLSYDPLRRLIEIQDWLGSTSIETDPLGRAIKVRDHNGKEVEYRYGNAGERLETVYPGGKSAKYKYDGALRLRQLTDGENTVSYTYDKNSRLSGKQLPNGTRVDYVYNAMGMLTGMTHSDGEGVLDRYTYQYDIMSNKTGIDKFRRGLEADSGEFRYGYDALGRLSDVSKDGALLRAYSYDPFGNRSLMTEGNKQTAYTYNVLNQLIRVETPELTRDYKYDARGNVSGVLENGITKRTYEFGANNRLEKAIGADGRMSLYRYNGLKQRVGLNTSDGLDPPRDITYVLDLTKQYHNLLQTDDGGQIKSYLWDIDVVAESSSEGERFYLHDELGSPLRLTDAEGALADSYAYDEFGNDLTGNQGVAQPFGYTGYRYDSLAGTYFAQAREYDPGIGRFTAEDSMRDSVNYYSYCCNNPLTYVDNNGLWTSDVHYDETLGWALYIGVPDDIAMDIARYDVGTDSVDNGTSPWPAIGDQSYHFNRSPFPTIFDSRINHANANFVMAVGIWNAAQLDYDKAMLRLSNASGSTERQMADAQRLLESRQQDALKLLGEGLHALQDIEAHGQIDAGAGGVIGHALYGKTPDNPDYDWLGNSRTILVKSTNRDRINETERLTKAYLNEFLYQTGIEKTESEK